MLNTLIVGASGYAGAELVTYINRHPHMNITLCFDGLRAKQ